MLRDAARALRDSSSDTSVLVRNQAGEVLKAAIQAGDLAAAEYNLTAEWGHESLYGGRVRLFTARESANHVAESSLAAITAERGVRVILRLPAADRFPGDAEYEQIFDWSASWACDPSLRQWPATRMCLAHRAGPVT